MLSHELAVPLAVVNTPLLMLYSPPLIEIIAGALVPARTIALDVYRVDSSALVTAVKLNALGIVSAGIAKPKRDN